MAATAEAVKLREIERPWGPQWAFLREPGALFRRYQGGQGSGKTVAGCFAVRQFAKKNPGAIIICTEPTYPMIRDIMQVEFDRQFKAAQLADGRDEWEAVTFHKSEMKYVLKNDSEIWLRQCDKFDALRGPSVAAVWMDEAAQSPHSAFQILVGRMRQRGFPHLFLCTGTPRGRGWLHWTFTSGQRPEYAPDFIGEALEELLDEVALQELRGDADGPLVESFFASSLDNPYLDPVTKAGLQGGYKPGTARFAQEVLGETTVFEGLVYPSFDELLHVDEPPPMREFVRFVGAQDWGYSNPGCLLVLGLHQSGQVWVLAERHEAKLQVAPAEGRPSWTAVATDFDEQFGLDRIVCDPSEPEAISHYLDAGLEARGAWTDMRAGLTEVDGLITANRLRVTPGCLAVLSEITSYVWKNRGTGDDALRTEEPEKVNDHAMDALRYGCMELRRPANTEPQVAHVASATVGGARRGRRRR